MQIIIILFNKITNDYQLEKKDNEIFLKRIDINIGATEYCLYKITEFLLNYFNQNIDKHSDKKYVALMLFNISLESSGEGICKFQEVIKLIQDDICKSLLYSISCKDVIMSG